MERSIEELSVYRFSKAKKDLENAIEFIDMIETYLKNKKVI